MPKYIQRTRHTKLPPNTKCCTRPSKWGNPFVVGEIVDNIRTWDKRHSVNRYKYYLENQFFHPNILGDLKELMEYDYLSCWCKESPCHVIDVLLPKVNGLKK